MEYVIQTNALTKLYGKKAAVDNMSIHVRKGDIYGLIGKNGAGKTTLMKLLLGLARATNGEIELFGGENLNEARRKIGSLVEMPALYKGETAFENMKRFATLSPTTDEDIKRYLDLVGLGDTGKKKVGAFSLGMKQRLGLAVALLGNPEILILDEPINGLDPAGMKEIRDVILSLNEAGVTFVISSHLLDELGKIATNYGILSNGVLVEEISAVELKERCRTSLKITVNDIAALDALLTANYADMQREYKDNTARIYTPVDDVSALVELLVKNGVKVYEIVYESKGYENFFIERLGE